MTDKRTVRKINRCIRKIALGRMDALEELFLLTKKPLFVVARSYLWDRSKAEDVLSDSYCKVVQGAASFDAKRNGYNWLYEIVKNTALNQNAADRLREQPLPDEAAPAADAVDELLDRLLAEEALAQIPAEERVLIFRYFFEGRTIREIAAEMHLSKSTVHERLQKILKTMKSALEEPESRAGKAAGRGEDSHE